MSVHVAGMRGTEEGGVRGDHVRAVGAVRGGPGHVVSGARRPHHPRASRLQPATPRQVTHHSQQTTRRFFG